MLSFAKHKMLQAIVTGIDKSIMLQLFGVYKLSIAVTRSTKGSHMYLSYGAYYRVLCRKSCPAAFNVMQRINLSK
jgi:predicted Co/Zn/Cd cation transporter (cation efflux family)